MGEIMPLNEADTRARLIEPKLKASGWTDKEISREFYYKADYQYTQGKIILVGDRIQRGKPKRVDYLLRYTDGFPIAVVEVKPEDSPPEDGLEQAKCYAQDLGLAFAYATNGHRILEYDFFTHTTRELTNFPTPKELWQRWKENTGLERPSALKTNVASVHTTFRKGQFAKLYCESCAVKNAFSSPWLRERARPLSRSKWSGNS